MTTKYKLPPLTKATLEGAAADCGCAHKPASSYPSLAEPMVAVEESPAPPPPLLQTLRVERATTTAEGTTFTTLKEVPFPKEACEGGVHCLPWVKIARDPKRFNNCLVEARKIGRIDCSKKLFDLIKDSLMAEDQECFYVILLDTQLYVRGISELARGARDRVNTPIPDVLRLPIVDGATAFMVAHNHPSGKVNPSQSDKELTKALVEAADAVGIPLFDHIIVGGDSYYSFADNKLM